MVGGMRREKKKCALSVVRWCKAMDDLEKATTTLRAVSAAKAFSRSRHGLNGKKKVRRTNA